MEILQYCTKTSICFTPFLCICDIVMLCHGIYSIIMLWSPTCSPVINMQLYCQEPCWRLAHCAVHFVFVLLRGYGSEYGLIIFCRFVNMHPGKAVHLHFAVIIQTMAYVLNYHHHTHAQEWALLMRDMRKIQTNFWYIVLTYMPISRYI